VTETTYVVVSADCFVAALAVVVVVERVVVVVAVVVVDVVNSGSK
jgi:hypothetical protein